MQDKLLALKWARKIIAAKSFVVLTDKESFIAMDGVNPNNINDLVTLQAQHSSIELFQDRLEQLKLEHEQRIAKLGGVVGITRTKHAKDVGTPRRTAASKAKRKV